MIRDTKSNMQKKSFTTDVTYAIFCPVNLRNVSHIAQIKTTGKNTYERTPDGEKVNNRE